MRGTFAPDFAPDSILRRGSEPLLRPHTHTPILLASPLPRIRGAYDEKELLQNTRRLCEVFVSNVGYTTYDVDDDDDDGGVLFIAIDAGSAATGHGTALH